MDAYGRVVHLQPVTWENDWPLIGKDTNNDGIGEPVMEWQKPNVGESHPLAVPATSDEFEEKKLGRQWQWQANPQIKWYSLTKNRGSLRLYADRNLTQNGNLWRVPNLLLQKFPAPSFTVSTKITFSPKLAGEKAGLVIMGKEWGYLATTKTDSGVEIGMYTGTYFQGYDKTEKIQSENLTQVICFLRVHVAEDLMCQFSYSLDGIMFHPIGTQFKATPGTWIGAKVGLFHINPNIESSEGYSDFDWFRFE